MLDQAQKDYIDDLRKNYTRTTEEELLVALTEAGWSETEVAAAVKRFYNVEEVLPPPQRRKTVTKAPESTLDITKSSDERGNGASLKNKNQNAVIETVETDNLSLANDVENQHQNQVNSVEKSHSVDARPLPVNKMILVGVSMSLMIVVLVGAVFVVNLFRKPAGVLTNADLLTVLTTSNEQIDTANFTFFVSANIVDRDEGALPAVHYLERFNNPEAELKKQSALFPVDGALSFLNKLPDLFLEYANPATLLGNVQMALNQPEEIFDDGDDSEYFAETDDWNVMPEYVNLDNSSMTAELKDVERIIPDNLSFSTKLVGNAHNPFKESIKAGQDFSWRWSAEATIDGLSLSFDTEMRRNNGDFFGTIHRTPMFFDDLAKLSGRWVKVTKEDMTDLQSTAFSLADIDSLLDIIDEAKINSSLGLEEYLSEDRREEFDDLEEQQREIMQAVSRQNIFDIVKGPYRTERDGQIFNTYYIKFRGENILPFYKDLTSALAKYKKPLLTFDAEVVEFLNSPEMKVVFEYFFDNMLIKLAVNDQGILNHYSVNYRFVPSDNNSSLKNKQLNITWGVDLKDINQPINIEAPAEFMSLDEFLMMVTDQSEVELKNNRQLQRLDNLRTNLNYYLKTSGTYPETLAELKENGLSKVNITDVFTGAEYGYINRGDDFEVQFNYQYEYDEAGKVLKPRNIIQMRTHKQLSGAGNVYIFKFFDGENIMTKEEMVNTTPAKDTDGDGVADDLEEILGLDPNNDNLETDGGYSDYRFVEQLFWGFYY